MRVVHWCCLFVFLRTFLFAEYQNSAVVCEQFDRSIRTILNLAMLHVAGLRAAKLSENNLHFALVFDQMSRALFVRIIHIWTALLDECDKLQQIRLAPKLTVIDPQCQRCI